jgi:hypothetical protein
MASGFGLCEQTLREIGCHRTTKAQVVEILETATPGDTESPLPELSAPLKRGCVAPQIRRQRGNLAAAARRKYGDDFSRRLWQSLSQRLWAAGPRLAAHDSRQRLASRYRDVLALRG